MAYSQVISWGQDSLVIVRKVRRLRWRRRRRLGIGRSGCHPSPVPEAAEHDLDPVAAPLATLVMFDGFAASLSAWNAGFDAFRPKSVPEPVGIIAAVTKLQIRIGNLRRYLSAIAAVPGRDLWIFEAPSKNGAVRTGVPQTAPHALGRRSTELKATPPFIDLQFKDGGAVKSSATSQRVDEFWQRLDLKPVIWNAVMTRVLPGKNGKDQPPSPAEIAEQQPILRAVAELCQPRWIIAAGGPARRAAAIFGSRVEHLDHPVARRRPNFKDRMQELYP